LAAAGIAAQWRVGRRLTSAFSSSPLSRYPAGMSGAHDDEDETGEEAPGLRKVIHVDMDAF